MTFDLIHQDFFGQNNYPRRTKATSPDNQGEYTPIDSQTIVKFFRKDLLSELGQGDIKKTPKMSEARLAKQKAKSEEPLSEKMKKEIIELFGENYDRFTC